MNEFEDATLLVGIGAPRTGTKWLSIYLASHPQILMSPIRVLHHFDARFLPRGRAYDQRFAERLAKSPGDAEDLRDRVRMASDEAAYIDFFRKRWRGERIFADVTPAYAMLPAAGFSAIAAAHPKVRILFTMRNPIDRFWSGMRLKKTREPTFDLGGALGRVTGRGSGEAAGGHDYPNTVERLDAAVPTEVPIIEFFETLLTEAGMARLCDRLGVDQVPAEIGTPQNQSDPAELPTADRAALYRRFAPTYRFAAERFGEALPDSWRRDMDAFEGAASA